MTQLVEQFQKLDAIALTSISRGSGSKSAISLLKGDKIPSNDVV